MRIDPRMASASAGGYDLKARRIVLIYVVAGLVWILGSDYVAEALVRVPYLPSLKGSLFVLTTAALLHVLLSRHAAFIRRSQAELVATEERFRSVVEHAPTGIFIQTHEKFRYLNPAALRLFGADVQEDLLGRPILDRVAPAFHDVVRRRIESLKTEPFAPPMAQKWIRLDGSFVDAELTSVPFDFDGVAGSMVFFTDITDRLRGEEERRALEQQVRQAQRMESVGRLAGGVAHDFNNLLTIINGYSDMLLRRTPHDNPNYEAILEVHNAGDRAVGITRQLLAFSRKEPLAPKILDPNHVIRETERMMRRLVGENVSLKLLLDPACGTVLADAGSLTQVLLNLAANARDAMHSGGEFSIETAPETVGPERSRKVADARAGDMVRITARDTGCGMDEQTRQRMFDPFFTTKPVGEGVGLGLSIVYGIVKSSLGWLEVASEPGRGSSVSIYLPACGERPAANSAATQSVAHGGHETILLVEDEPGVRGYAEMVLTGAGYRVIACANADQALAESSQPIDLLLTDVIMPGASGTELARRLGDRSPNVRVILMSGYSKENLTPSATSSHRVFLPKPFSASALLAAVRRVLDGPQPARPAP